MLSIAEEIFSKQTHDRETLKKIDCSLITDLSMQNMNVMANFNLILEQCDVAVPQCVAEDTLCQMFALFSE